ncbi:DUF2989 domain-containing protein [Vibrio maritimus]|uniref:DUF2989 domain-containing protein n=1 Tax=Vibrio maritimus TaxID=990268 RepID=UPI0040693CC2
MKLPHALLVLLSASMLAGCFEARKNTDQLCEQEPSLNCAVLNTSDGQCRIPRTNLIWHRYEMMKAPSEANTIEEYYLLKEYRKCLELASQIQPIEQADLKARRFDALMYSINEQERVTKSLSSSTSPDTLYFLWSETGDHTARRRFLEMEGSPQLDTAELQYALATYYISRDKNKTYQLLNRSLELSSGGKTVNKDVIKALASVTQSLNQPQQSFLWAMVAKQFDIPIASDNELRLMFDLEDSEYDRLRSQANTVAKAIKNGSYSPNLSR